MEIPLRCRKCHAHGHLFKDFPLNKQVEITKGKQGKDVEGFKKFPAKGKVLCKLNPQPNTRGARTNNSFVKVAKIEEQQSEIQMVVQIIQIE